ARRQHQAVPLDVVAELRIHVVLVVEGENAMPCLPGPALTGRDLRAQRLHPRPLAAARRSYKGRKGFTTLGEVAIGEQITEAKGNHRGRAGSQRGRIVPKSDEPP